MTDNNKKKQIICVTSNTTWATSQVMVVLLILWSTVVSTARTKHGRWLTFWPSVELQRRRDFSRSVVLMNGIWEFVERIWLLLLLWTILPVFGCLILTHTQIGLSNNGLNWHEFTTIYLDIYGDVNEKNDHPLKFGVPHFQTTHMIHGVFSCLELLLSSCGWANLRSCLGSHTLFIVFAADYQTTYQYGLIGDELSQKLVPRCSKNLEVLKCLKLPMVFGAKHPNPRPFSLEVPHIDRDASPEASGTASDGVPPIPSHISIYCGSFLNLGLLLVWWFVYVWCGLMWFNDLIWRYFGPVRSP